MRLVYHPSPAAAAAAFVYFWARQNVRLPLNVYKMQQCVYNNNNDNNSGKGQRMGAPHLTKEKSIS